MIEREGWYQVRTRGDHRQYKHRDRPGRVTISGNLGDEVKKGTLASILCQAGLRGENR